MESMVSKLRAELRSREAEAAAADRVAVRANPDVEELQRRHREVVSTTVESYEGKLWKAKESMSQVSGAEFTASTLQSTDVIFAALSQVGRAAADQWSASEGSVLVSGLSVESVQCISRYRFSNGAERPSTF